MKPKKTNITNNWKQKQQQQKVIRDMCSEEKDVCYVWVLNLFLRYVKISVAVFFFPIILLSLCFLSLLLAVLYILSSLPFTSLRWSLWLRGYKGYIQLFIMLENLVTFSLSLTLYYFPFANKECPSSLILPACIIIVCICYHCNYHTHHCWPDH